jgi:hypothetical protein
VAHHVGDGEMAGMSRGKIRVRMREAVPRRVRQRPTKVRGRDSDRSVGLLTLAISNDRYFFDASIQSARRAVPASSMVNVLSEARGAGTWSRPSSRSGA